MSNQRLKSKKYFLSLILVSIIGIISIIHSVQYLSISSISSKKLLSLLVVRNKYLKKEVKQKATKSYNSHIYSRIWYSNNHSNLIKLSRNPVNHSSKSLTFQPIKNFSWESVFKYSGKPGKITLKISPRGCIPSEQWQTINPTTCNTIHEYNVHEKLIKENAFIRGSGSKRDSWLLQHYNDEQFILKILHMQKITNGLLEKQRIDAVVTEQLTFSSNVINAYGYCGGSVLNEFANGGTLHHVFSNTLRPGNIVKISDSLQTFLYAHELAKGLADIHSVHDHTNQNHTRSSIRHGDLHVTSNILLHNGSCKYHDFNKAQFLRKHFKTGRFCGFYKTKNNCRVGSFKCPPEEQRRSTYISEKAEIFYLGLIYLKLLAHSDSYDLGLNGDEISFEDIFEDENQLYEWAIVERKKNKNRKKSSVTDFKNEIKDERLALTEVAKVTLKALESNPIKRLTAKQIYEDLDEYYNSMSI